MTYATEIVKDFNRREMFLVLKPKKRLSGNYPLDWTRDGANLRYSKSFTFGKVTAVSVANVAFTLGTSAATLSTSQYYYDSATQMLTIRKADSSAVADTDYVIVTFELYFSTKEALFYRVPTDSTTETVLFRGVINAPPTVARSCQDQIFGFSPVSATSVGVALDPEYVQELLYDTTFVNAEISIYHCAGKISTANFQKIFTGVGGNFTVTDKSLNIEIFDKTYQFDKQMDNSTAYAATFTKPSTTGANTTDPQYANRPIRSIYGAYYAIKAVCLDYNDASPTTSLNRKWALMTQAWGSPAFGITIATRTSNTSFSVGLTTARRLKTAFDAGFPTITDGTAAVDITSINTSTGAVVCGVGITVPGAGSSITFVPFRNVHIIHDNTWWKLTYKTHYSLASLPDNTFGIQLVNNMEGSLASFVGIINPSTSFITADVYGHNIGDYASGLSGSALTDKRGTNGNPIEILYHVLKYRLGLDDTQIDVAALTTAATNTNATCYCSIPATWNDDFPTYRTVITNLLTVGLCRAYFDADGKFTVKPIGLATSPAPTTLTDQDIAGSISFDYRFDDISDVKILGGIAEKYLIKDAAEASGTSGRAAFYDNVYQAGPYTWQNKINTYLHKTGKTRTVETYFGADWVSYDSIGDAIFLFAARLVYLLGDRRGLISVYARSGAWSVEIGDTVELQRVKIQGYAYNEDTERTRSFVVVDTRKEINGVHLVLDDQKSIQENSGDW